MGVSPNHPDPRFKYTSPKKWIDIFMERTGSIVPVGFSCSVPLGDGGDGMGDSCERAFGCPGQELLLQGKSRLEIASVTQISVQSHPLVG